MKPTKMGRVRMRVLQDTDLKNPVLVLGRVGGGGQSIRKTQTKKIGLGLG